MPEAVEAPQPSPQNSTVDRFAPVLLTLLLVLAASLRLAGLSESLWLDELHTAWTIDGSFSEMHWRSTQGNQMPLYFWIVRSGVAVLGNNEFALRLPSLVAGLGLLWAMYALVALWSGSKAAGLLAASLAAIDPVFVFYAVEARTYAIVQLLAVFQVYLFWRSLGDKHKHWRSRGLLIGVSTAMFYLHYTTCLLLLAEATWLLIALARRRLEREVAVRFGWDLLIVCLLCLPTAPHVAAVAARREQWKLFIPQPTIGGISAIIGARTYFTPAILVLGLAALLRHQQKQKWPRVPSIPLGLILCWLLVPVLSAWLLTRQGVAPLFLFRYVIVSSPTPIILAAMAFAICPGRLFRRTLAMAVIVAAVANCGLLEWQPGDPANQKRGQLKLHLVSPRHRRNEDWRAAVQWLRTQPPKPLLLRSGLVEARRRTNAGREEREYDTLPVRSIYRLDDRFTSIVPFEPASTLKLPAEARRRIRFQQGAYLLIKDSPRKAALGAEVTARQLGCSIDTSKSFGNLSGFALTPRRRSD